MSDSLSLLRTEMLKNPARPRVAAWKLVLGVLAIWGVFLVLAALANFHDHLEAGLSSTLNRQLLLFFTLLLPKVVLSCALALLFEYHQDRILNLKSLSLLFVAIFFVFLPVYVIVENAYFLYRSRNTVPSISQIIAMISPIPFWLDAMVLAFAFSLQIAFTFWQRNRYHFLRAQTEKQTYLQLKLRQLQGQLEPYFLLNSLEGIGHLVVDADRSLATRALAKLSDLLRHVLDSGQKEWQSVDDELQFIKDFFSLQSLQLNEQLAVHWEIGSQNWSHYLCPPLLFQPLLEYTIRHAQSTSEDARIHLTLRCELVASHVEFCLLFNGAPNLDFSKSEEIQNLQERMQLIFKQQAFIRLESQKQPDTLGSSDLEAKTYLPTCFKLRFPAKTDE